MNTSPSTTSIASAISYNVPAADPQPIVEEFKKRKIQKWNPPDSDDENDENRHFDVLDAWSSLFKLPSCVTLMINLAEQQKLKIVVGTNVSQEFPWKQIRLQYLYNADLFDSIENGDDIITQFRQHNTDNHILIGYAPILTQDLDDIPKADPFIAFSNPDDAKVALIIIRNIENYENWAMTQRLHKKPRPWYSYGSSREVHHMLQRKALDPVDVEIQSIYPLKIPAEKNFSMRYCDDVRDGYVELLPQESIKFENITRKRITVAIQSSPTLITKGSVFELMYSIHRSIVTCAQEINSNFPIYPKEKFYTKCLIN